MRYAVVIEPSADGFGAYVPDLPGCVAVSDSIEEAVAFHLEGRRADGFPIPDATDRQPRRGGSV